MIDNDTQLALLAQVQQLLKDKQQATIQGQGSRSCATSNSVISLKNHAGVIAYEPSELVIKVRAGTLIKDIKKLLEENNQQLGTDFPDYGSSTIGGAIATGETGAGRPFLGAIRDQVLGLGIINGKAQALNFGGQVMKNVAGYDVSRLLCGSRGQLAVITDVTLKVVPLTQSISVAIAPEQNNLTLINQLAAQALPISAAVIDQGLIRIRLSGSAAVTAHAMQQMNAQPSQLTDDYWDSISNKTHDFFNTDSAIWQVRLAATKILEKHDSTSLIDWCGHQRYIKTDDDLSQQNQLEAQCIKNNNALLYPTHQQHALSNIHKALKNAFDEHNIFSSH